MNLSKFMSKYRLLPEDVIPIVQQVADGFTKRECSMCVHSDRYGVQLSPKAAKVLKEYYEKPDRNAPKQTKKRVSVLVDSENVEAVREIIRKALEEIE